LRELRKRRWYPVVAAQTIQFRRSLYPFKKFQVTTEVVGWDGKYHLGSSDGLKTCQQLLTTRIYLPE
jgi:hypothetical protein